MTLILSEGAVSRLLAMRETITALERSFVEKSKGADLNAPRTRSATSRSPLSLMHASLPYLGRAGVKCYLNSSAGTRFVVVLFDSSNSSPLAVMGADHLGRLRTGAASAVATKHMYGRSGFRFAICGSGKQAVTQVSAMLEIGASTRMTAWSPNRARLRDFARTLAKLGVDCAAADGPAEAFSRADAGTSITSSEDPFISTEAVRGLGHLNVCGSNSPERAELMSDALAEFGTVAVDDIRDAELESGDLIQAARSGYFSWDKAVELADVVAGKVRPQGKTLFKSNGIAAEDVAVASLVYDNALKAGDGTSSEVDLLGLLEG